MESTIQLISDPHSHKFIKNQTLTPILKEAGEKLTLLHLSEEERQAYERYIGDVRISRSTLESSFYDGITQGRAAGRTEGKVEMIQRLHQLGISLEQIVTAAQLSYEEVKAILEQ